MITTFAKDATFRETLGPAMEITDQQEADDYFESLVRHVMGRGKTREKAEETTRSNLGYFAGYYDSETRRRVERLFRCAHPVFGSIEEKGAPTTEEAFESGARWARGDKP